MYTALYRQKRPETFREVIGQEHIIKVLENQVATNTVGHAYLFCGTRGTGKTTVARLLAKAVNCQAEESNVRPCGQCSVCNSIKEGSFVDVIELDAASNRGVDNVRELRESVKYPPAAGRKKVYIIDEVHMLTIPAFNALLKTLEEPPENIILILATTDPQQLPQTILSRCQRLDFRRVSQANLAKYLHSICDERNVAIDDRALDVLVSGADGSVRDGLSLLDQCLATGESSVDEKLVLDFLGLVSTTFLLKLTDCAIERRMDEGLVMISEAMNGGKDARQLIGGWLSHYRNLLIAKFVENPKMLLNLSSEAIALLQTQGHRLTVDSIDSGIMTLAKTALEAKQSTQPRVLLDLAFVKITSQLAGGNLKDTAKLDISSPDAGEKKSVFIEPKVITENLSVRESVNEKNETDADNIQETENALKADYNTPTEKTEDVVKQDVKRNQPTRQSTNLNDISKGEAWQKICDLATKQRRSIGSLRNKAEIYEIGENTLTIAADNKITEERLVNGEKVLSQSAAEVFGRPMKIKVMAKDKVSSTETIDTDETIKALYEMFGEDLVIKK